IRSNRIVDLRPLGAFAAAEVRNTGSDDAIGKVPASRGAQAAVLKPGAPSLFRPEALVGKRLIDETVRDLGPAVGTLLLHRDRNRKMGNPVKEIGGPIERIDKPAWLGRI